ncbi:MAG: tRNA guanosine(34) transglycosylase Tgt [Candidatus Parcubacteria bacterium]|nr:tRNA guanosine(34) transglycosylase Tgt [Candidatus Parcubacteria bacterium]
MFEIVKKSKKNRARLGKMSVSHGFFNTPVFMPPGTLATVKAIGPDDLKLLEAEIILVNAYHLHLRPGEKLIHDLGGVHKFMAWPSPILSDSGGFQVWSLAQAKRGNSNLVKVTDDGVKFKSPLDGSSIYITPEKSVEIQHTLGTDIVMCFDECLSDKASHAQAVRSLERTNQWALRCVKRHLELLKNPMYTKYQPKLFGIIQGGIYADLRREAVSYLSELPFDGLALGGETIGYNMPKTLELLDEIKDMIPEKLPLYTMGLGASPQDAIDVVKRGVDMFDCVNPARIARHGQLYNGRIVVNKTEIKIDSEFKGDCLRILNERFKKDSKPIDEDCDCYTCSNFSRAYLRHLYLNQETLYLRLATIHNLRYMIRLIHALREKI